jgi:hypothetical protein
MVWLLNEMVVENYIYPSKDYSGMIGVFVCFTKVLQMEAG